MSVFTQAPGTTGQEEGERGGEGGIACAKVKGLGPGRGWRGGGSRLIIL